MTATVEGVRPTVRPLQMAAIVPVITAGVLLSALLLLVLGLLGLLAGLLLTALAAVGRLRGLTRGIEAEVLGRIGAEAPSGALEARLDNLAESLAAQSGVPVPLLRVVDDPGANMLVVGTAPDAAVLVVTTGLLAGLDRMQLEAIVGRGIAEIRSGDLPASTMAVRSVGRPAAALDAGGPRALVARPFAGLVTAGAAFVGDPDRDLLLDQAAVALTRFPPALISALERCAAIGTELRRQDPALDHLWMAATGATGRAVVERPDLQLRIEALRLL
ncbi:MAG: hypothetical protein KGR18_03720 [Acidobacteria bacterium]|nr:hypothetical protein [Acidobacteriota bacterium]